jgi:hypothetical protein
MDAKEERDEVWNMLINILVLRTQGMGTFFGD